MISDLRRALVLTGLAIGLLGCGGPTVVMRSAPCLDGPVPRVGRPVPDEMFALMHRERTRAAQASPLVRARILESIPRLFPDVSSLLLPPQCHDELEREATAVMEQAPLVLDRLLIARIRTVHDAPPLIALALRDEATISPYRLGPDEPGPPPPKSFLRYRALANIPASWITYNRPVGRGLLLDRLRASTDATELLLLHGATTALLEQALGGDSERDASKEGRALLGQMIVELGKRLQGPPDRAALELALLHVADLGHVGVRLGHEQAARAVVKTVLDARGDLPLTRGVPGAVRDLAEVARRALFHLDTPQQGMGYEGLPPPRRERFDPRADWLDREPAGGRPSDADRAARVRDLDEELAGLKYNRPRCHVIEQLGEWLSDADAAARFEGLIAPSFQGDRVVWNTESLCRLRVALSLAGVSEDKRAALALRMLRTPVPPRGARDHSLDEHGPAIAHSADEDSVRQIAVAALKRQPDWMGRYGEIRSWLEEKAKEPIPRDADPAQTWSELGPVFERLVAFHLGGGPEARPEIARAILSAWIGSIRTVLSAPLVGHIYLMGVTRQRIRALGEWGKQAGMSADVNALLDELKRPGEALIARYLLELGAPSGG